jgi:hypothetical protein
MDSEECPVCHVMFADLASHLAADTGCVIGSGGLRIPRIGLMHGE